MTQLIYAVNWGIIYDKINKMTQNVTKHTTTICISYAIIMNVYPYTNNKLTIAYYQNLSIFLS